MANITVTIDDEVYRAARVHAAKVGTSVSALVREFLEGIEGAAAEHNRLLRLQEDVMVEIDGFRGGNRIGREDLHDRALC